MPLVSWVRNSLSHPTRSYPLPYGMGWRQVAPQLKICAWHAMCYSESRWHLYSCLWARAAHHRAQIYFFSIFSFLNLVHCWRICLCATFVCLTALDPTVVSFSEALVHLQSIPFSLDLRALPLLHVHWLWLSKLWLSSSQKRKQGVHLPSISASLVCVMLAIPVEATWKYLIISFYTCSWSWWFFPIRKALILLILNEDAQVMPADHIKDIYNYD